MTLWELCSTAKSSLQSSKRGVHLVDCGLHMLKDITGVVGLKYETSWSRSCLLGMPLIMSASSIFKSHCGDAELDHQEAAAAGAAVCILILGRLCTNSCSICQWRLNC